MPKIENQQKLFQQTEKRFEELNYASVYKTQMLRILHKFKEFSMSLNPQKYSTDIGEAFIEHCYNKGNLFFQDGVHRIVDKVNDVYLHGTFNKRCDYRTLSWPEKFKEICDEYYEYRKKGLSEKSALNMIHLIHEFVSFFDASGLTDISQLSQKTIEAYTLTLAKFASSAVRIRTMELKLFCKYFISKEAMDENVLFSIPLVRYADKPKIPSTFNEKEIEMLLSAVDKTSAIGMRDLAILILAAKTGLRVSDITGLEFKNIKWDKNSIELIQHKTKIPITLPLSTEVGLALIDYIKNGRPVTDCQKVFVRHIPPYDKLLTASHLVKEYMLKAKIRIKKGPSYGMHILRHSLASILLDHNTPYPVIADTLGHVVGSDATKRYMMIDLKRLRQCSLEVPSDD